jgi:DNA-binding response OmpR family regulator
MNPTTRPPPTVLFIHNGMPYEKHIQHLLNAGLRVSEAHADAAVAEAVRLQPDMIVLDFDCDGDVTAQLKAHTTTKDIPVIALVELTER